MDETVPNIEQGKRPKANPQISLRTWVKVLFSPCALLTCGLAIIVFLRGIIFSWLRGRETVAGYSFVGLGIFAFTLSGIIKSWADKAKQNPLKKAKRYS